MADAEKLDLDGISSGEKDPPQDFIEKMQEELNTIGREKSEQASQEEVEPIKGSEKICEQLKEAMQAKDIDSRSSLGQKFQRFLKSSAEASEQYANLQEKGKTYDLKRRFRLKWAQTQWEKNTVQTKCKLQSWQTIDEESGTYEPFDRIIHFEGGKESKPAVQAATLYVQKAKQMGGQWVMWNPMTERTDILYIKKSLKKVFQQKWDLYSTATGESTVIEEEIHALTPQKSSTSSSEAVCPEAVQPSASVIPTAPKKRAKPDEAEDKQTKKRKADILKKCQRCKQTYLKVTAVCREMIRNIRENEEYSWANNDLTLKRLEEPMKTLQSEVTGNVFNNFFLLNDIAEARSKFTDWDTRLEAFSSIESKVKGLEAETTRFNKMHSASRLK